MEGEEKLKRLTTQIGRGRSMSRELTHKACLGHLPTES